MKFTVDFLGDVVNYSSFSKLIAIEYRLYKSMYMFRVMYKIKISSLIDNTC